jgi:4-hydroxy-3-polyprenylbenzoate decarboxylase
MGTAHAIAYGASGNLLERAADVMIKEKRRLVVVPRETPLSAIHLSNLLLLAQNGVSVVPPMPAFYAHPQSVESLVTNFTGRLLDQLGIENDIAHVYTGL